MNIFQKGDYHPTPLMKAVQIGLLVLIVIGIGLLITKDRWVPSVVSAIMSHDGEVVVDQTPTPLAPQGIAVGEPNPSAPTPATSGKKMAFMDFVKQGGAYQCTVHQLVQGVDTTGVTYVSGGMLRGEYATEVQGNKGETTVIMRDGYSYIWMSMMPGTGFKAKVVESTEADPNAPTSASYAWNGSMIGEYDCQPTAVDASMFALPKDVTFTEVPAQ